MGALRYIDDIVDGVVACIDLGAPWEIFNLGNSAPEPLGALLGLIEEGVGRAAEKVMKPQPPGAHRAYCDPAPMALRVLLCRGGVLLALLWAVALDAPAAFDGYTTIIHSKGDAQTAHGDYA